MVNWLTSALLTFIFDRQPIKLRLQVEVREEQMNTAPWFRNDQPHTVEIVPVFLRIVWGQHCSRWGREVEETRNYEDKGQLQRNEVRKKK